MINAPVSHRLRIASDTLEEAANEIDTLRRALSWIADQDPQIVDAAFEKFGLTERR